MPEEQKTSPLAIIVAVVAVVIVIVLVVVLLQNQNTPTTTTTNTSTNNTTNTTPVTNASQTFTMAEQNGSGQSGTVTLEDVGTQVRVTITLSNPITTAEPAHIHTGSCPTPGAVVYPLQNVVNGTSVTMVDTTIANLKTMVPLAVNVHKSASESSVYYSCADLSF